MAAQKGKTFRIFIGNGGSPETFAAIGGARADSLRINNTLIDTTNKDTDDWSDSLEDAGIRSMQLSVSGIFSNSAAEALLEDAALDRTKSTFRIEKGNGDYYLGKFRVTDYGSEANHDGTVTYSATMQSAGEVTLIRI